MANSIACQIVEAGAYINNWDSNWVKLPDGTETPAYLSCRRLISVPRMKRLVKEALGDLAQDKFADKATSVMGLATAGIIWGDAVSERLNLPFGYVRGEKKVYGIGKLVEGNPPVGGEAVLVDDTLLTGKSFAVAREALLQERGTKTIGAITIASLYTNGPEAFGVEFGTATYSLATHGEICEAALQTGLLNESQYGQMMDYYADPSGYVFEERRGMHDPATMTA
jgi:orotate phosphoribosyltransferase